MSTAASDAGTARPAPSNQPTWPVRSGPVAPLADCYTPRTESGLSLAASLSPGETAVLVSPDETRGLGGTGKTQLAAAIAHTLLDRQAVDLLVWLTAASRDSIITGYAQALTDVGLLDPDGVPEAAATRFLAWLAQTSRPWLVVLDDLCDATAVDGLWPAANGRVLVTTDRPDSALGAARPRRVEVGPFTSRESLAYLSTKLQGDPDQWIGALDLATDLGFLPIALAQAGALMVEAGIDCRNYRGRVAQRRQRQLVAPPASQYATVVATGELALELADRLPPAGLARPALALIAQLDPNGVSGAVLTSPAACTFLARMCGMTAVDELTARTAVHNLSMVGLVTVDTTSAARTVRAHAIVQATARHNLSAAEADLAVRAAADALMQAWPRRAAQPQLEQALRDCTGRLHANAGVLLWRPQCHPVLLRAGRSLDAAGLASPALAYWQMMTDISRPALGAAHPQTLFARDRLAAACAATGRLDEAIALWERALAERELASQDTPGILSSLARAYRQAGRTTEAVKTAERLLAGSEPANGPLHPDTLLARAELGQAYLSAGLGPQAITAFEQTLAGWEQTLGSDHPDTIAARGSLASAYRAAGRHKDATAAFKRALADRERTAGPDHPDTIAARGALASAYRAAGRHKDAIPLYQRALADWERTAGPDHPDTIAARGALASAYQAARKKAKALPLYEQALADSQRVLGPDHPLTKAALDNYQAARS